MDRIEAIKVLNRFPVNYTGMTINEANRVDEALAMAISAIRPVTREQVEKVWRGCEYCAGDVNDRPYLDSKEIYIYDDGILMNGYESACKILFCPKCGRPLTDEAVDMVMERLEALKDG